MSPEYASTTSRQRGRVAPEKAHHRARVASLNRSRTPDDPELIGARQDLAVANLADAIAKTVAEWPDLPPAQVDRLAILLRGGDAA